jgi:hypothetical protein
LRRHQLLLAAAVQGTTKIGSIDRPQSTQAQHGDRHVSRWELRQLYQDAREASIIRAGSRRIVVFFCDDDAPRITALPPAHPEKRFGRERGTR